ncbi:MAG: protein kinase, partial [Verrucomicrobia bacterium]|nr:protein kinase [Verrucomicrobiota bacterium]
ILGDPSARRRFVREARAAASSNHANVGSVFHLGRQDDLYYYAMQFVDGEGLDRVILRTFRLEASTALSVAARVAAGLEAIAKQNLVHRDIKPSNIVVVLKGAQIVNAKIIDLGLAKNIADDELPSTMSDPGSFVGTPAYASPEQFAGIEVDIRSDLYSLGVTLWEMLSGEPPFRGSSTELSYLHRSQALPVERLKQFPRPIVRLLVKLLEKDPSRRFQSPTDLLRAIAKVTETFKSERCVATNRADSRVETVSVRRDRSTRNWRPALSSAKALAGRRLVALVLGVAGLCTYLLLTGQQRLLFNQREDCERSIAVLPFENLGCNQEDADFVDGLHDEILRYLAGVTQLRVVSRTSVMRYQRDNLSDPRQITNELGVTNVLEGTIRRDGNRVRVSMELVDAVNDNTIWADSYDRNLTDVLTSQSEIAEQVAARIIARFKLERPEREREKTNR